MVLALVHVLRKKILSNEVFMSDLESTTKFSCYELSFGHFINYFELLKLELDFEVGTLNFYIEYGPSYWLCALALADTAIDYIVSKL